ncbi:MAG TPA: hypothetical protein PLZ79_06650 [Burkholderiales bacterium]|nr:hypothetical protein [Burkholderiales bacterium]
MRFAAAGIAWIAVGACVAVLCACASTPAEPALTSAQRAKIALDLSTLDERGLRGPPRGLRSMSYEFCIPANERYATEVQHIDPTLELMRGSRGRIGCTKDQYLCVGQTGQRNYRQVLERLAALDYTSRIVESTFE